jgi:hypothetical protein
VQVPTRRPRQEHAGEPLDDQAWACVAALLLIPGLIIVTIGAAVSWFLFAADWGVLGLLLSLAIANTVTFIVPIALGALGAGAATAIGLGSLQAAHGADTWSSAARGGHDRRPFTRMSWRLPSAWTRC